MSILIKGMDMPKNGEVILRIKPNGNIHDMHDILLTETKAIEIPTPHGRLIDESQINIYYINYGDKGEIKVDAPTILEAEE